MPLSTLRATRARPSRSALAVILAVSAIAGHAATPAPIPVTVANAAPVPVDATAAQPYVVFQNVTVSNGSAQTTFSTPAGKRFVVQSMSVYRSGTLAAGSTEQVFVIPTFNGVQAYMALPPIVGTGGQFPAQSIATTFYIDGGTSPQIVAFGSGAQGSGTVGVTLIGYLVNLP